MGKETAMDFDLEKATEILERTPGVLRSLLQDLSADWTQPNEGTDTWSPYDVVGHLIHGERTDWIVRAKLILDQKHEPFTPFDRFAQFRESDGKSLDELLDEFETIRRQNLESVASWRLTDAQLSLEGTHPVFGAVTLRQLLSTWVAHDLAHIGQIVRVMAKQYGNAVGPWRAYLPILDR
jgi:uncharacterized damage-inducible protein DinB